MLILVPRATLLKKRQTSMVKKLSANKSIATATVQCNKDKLKSSNTDLFAGTIISLKSVFVTPATKKR